MRFLGVGDYCDLASLYLRLAQEGHEVKVYISEPLCHGTLAGMVQRVDDWEEELSWIRKVGHDGIILFENVADNRGAKQDALRADGLNVVGGSAFGDRLENDRVFAQGVLHSLGMSVAPTFEFATLASASAFIKSRPMRYVLKFNGDEFGAADNYVGRFPDGRDVLALIAAKFRQVGRDRISFVLMDHLSGIEMGVGAFFNGEEFLQPACLDWEHKRFFPGDMGELTGEMGTVVTFERTSTFFKRTLARVSPLLKANNYCGYINLNTIVNDDGVWPLEFTCRFGYPGYAILEPLQKIAWPALLQDIIQRSSSALPVEAGFAVGVVITTRPFPYVRSFVPEPIGLPITFDGELSNADRSNLHFGEVGLVNGELVTAGYHGWTMVVTGKGPSIREAQIQAYGLAERVVIPNARYRNDIGTRLIEKEFSMVEQLGLLDDR
jgi:phosphoribosylamine--glycine ligase